MVQDETWYLPVHDVIRMFPSFITQIERATFLLVIIQEDSLLAVLVLEVAPIHAGKGLLIDLRRYAASLSMMIGDLKQWLVTHQILQRLAQHHERAEQEYTPFSMRQQHSYERRLLLINSFVGSTNGNLPQIPVCRQCDVPLHAKPLPIPSMA